jgi:hypothetical protein
LFIHWPVFIVQPSVSTIVQSPASFSVQSSPSIAVSVTGHFYLSFNCQYHCLSHRSLLLLSQWSVSKFSHLSVTFFSQQLVSLFTHLPLSLFTHLPVSLLTHLLVSLFTHLPVSQSSLGNWLLHLVAHPLLFYPYSCLSRQVTWFLYAGISLGDDAYISLMLTPRYFWCRNSHIYYILQHIFPCIINLVTTGAVLSGSKDVLAYI